MSVITDPSYWSEQAYLLGQKVASDSVPVPSYSLSGLLYVSTAHDGKPWGLLSVPNALVRGVFDAMHVVGAELPLSNGKLDASIAVFTPDEIEQIGGADKLINDRGKPHYYSLGRLVEAAGDGDISKSFSLRVHSGSLQLLRRSYGLSSLPAGGQGEFNITVAVVRRGVLGRNSTSKDTTAA